MGPASTGYGCGACAAAVSIRSSGSVYPRLRAQEANASTGKDTFPELRPTSEARLSSASSTIS